MGKWEQDLTCGEVGTGSDPRARVLYGFLVLTNKERQECGQGAVYSSVYPTPALCDQEGGEEPAVGGQLTLVAF